MNMLVYVFCLLIALTNSVKAVFIISRIYEQFHLFLTVSTAGLSNRKRFIQTHFLGVVFFNSGLTRNERNKYLTIHLGKKHK